MKMAEATYYGTGRRKTSVARVRLVAGQGNIVINGRVLDDYFDLKTLEIIVKQPLELTGTTAVYDVIASVKGGGASGQASKWAFVIKERSSWGSIMVYPPACPRGIMVTLCIGSASLSTVAMIA